MSVATGERLISTAAVPGAGYTPRSGTAEQKLFACFKSKMGSAITTAPGAHESNYSPHGVSAGPKILLLAAVTIIVVITAIRAWTWWRNDAGISFASGVVISMATDLKQGVFYRPLYDSRGYGGTRYFPLFFCLQALLLKLGMPVLASAYLLSAAAIVLLMLGTFQLLRQLGVEPWLAGCSALMVLAAGSVQMSLSTPQADGLAAALNVCGLAAIARPAHSRRRIFLAALLFALAWSAKLTTVFGLAAACIWLLAKGYKRVAWLLVAETCCGYLLVAGVMIVASHGRIVGIFRACASGGTNWKFIASGFSRMESMAVYTDPALVLFAVLAFLLFAFLAGSGKLLQNLPALFFLATIAITILIFGSPGTAANHLLDVQVASVILLAAWVGNSISARRTQIGGCLLALLTIIAAVPLLRHLRTWSAWYHPHQFRQVIAVIGPTEKPILSENPVVPALAGQYPYVLDPWMVQLLRKRIAGFEEPLLEGLRRQAFSAVVLSADPNDENVRSWYDTVSFGPGFVPALNENYRLAQVIDKDWIYLPITQPPRESGAN